MQLTHINIAGVFRTSCLCIFVKVYINIAFPKKTIVIMRKLLVILLATLLVAPVEYASAQNLSKAIKKEYKAKMKQLKKEKWELYGSSRTLDVTLARYYEELGGVTHDLTDILL